MATEKRNESIKPVCWIQSNHLDQLIYKAVGSDAMHARVSTKKLASDWKPLYTTLQPDVSFSVEDVDNAITKLGYLNLGVVASKHQMLEVFKSMIATIKPIEVVE